MMFFIKAFIGPYLIPIVVVTSLLIAGDVVRKFFGRYFYLALGVAVVLFGIASFISGDRYRARLCEIEKQQSKTNAQNMDLDIGQAAEADNDQRENALQAAAAKDKEKVENNAKTSKENPACRITQPYADRLLGIR